MFFEKILFVYFKYLKGMFTTQDVTPAARFEEIGINA